MKKIILVLLFVFLCLAIFADINIKLLTAAESGDLNKVKKLIAQGANVNAKGDRYSNTALMCAAAGGHTKIAKLLIQAGAYVNAKNKWGSTALMSAVVNGHTEVAVLLIQAEADVNSQAKHGWTALMSAAANGHTEMRAHARLLNRSKIPTLPYGCMNLVLLTGHTPVRKVARDITKSCGWYRKRVHPPVK